MSQKGLVAANGEFVVGVDGCKAGWIAAVNQNGEWDIEVFPAFDALWRKYKMATHFLVDIPIGLVEQGNEGRQCDQLARKRLSPYRHSSIFTPPCRAALYVDPEQVSSVNFNHTSKKLSRQSINIIPKIREVDAFLLRQPKAVQSRIYEAHPELIFYGLNAGLPLQENKKTKAGLEKRIGLINYYFPFLDKLYQEAYRSIPRKQAAADDIVDALSLAVAATLSVQDPAKWQQIPDIPILDKQDLPMQLVYFLATTPPNFHNIDSALLSNDI